MRKANMIGSLMDMIRLSDDAPDADRYGLRGGIPVETPQEIETKEGISGDGQGVAKGWPVGGQRVARGWPWYSRGVPTTEISPLWWAKATRLVKWRYQKVAKQCLWWGGVAVCLLLSGCGAAPEALVLAGILAIAFFLIDPFEAFGRRLALQSRCLLSIAGGVLIFSVCNPSVPAFATFAVCALFALLLTATCNTEWVVTANYISSPAIHSAMAKDSTNAAHRSWSAIGGSLAYTFSSEMGYPPTSNFIWGILRGVYVIGWSLGFRKIVTEEECLKSETDGERVRELLDEVDRLRSEKYDLEDRLANVVGDEDREGYEEEIRNLNERLTYARLDYQGLREKLKEKELEKERELAEAEERRKKDLEAIAARHRKELDALEAAHAAEKTSIEEECQKAIEDAETAMLAGENGLREKLILAELRNGTTSQKQLSEITGIPRTTLRRILDRWKVEGTENGQEEWKPELVASKDASVA